MHEATHRVDIFIGAQPNTADAPPIEFLLGKLKTVADMKDAFEVHTDKGALVKDDDPPDAGRKLLYLSDVKIDPDERYAVLLFNYGDKDTPNPAFAHFGTHDIREVTKRDNEGVAYSAHLIIDLEPKDLNPHMHKATFEKVPMINRGVVLAFLNRLLRRIAKDNVREFQFADPETNKVRSFRPKLNLDLEPHQTLRDSIVSGRGELAYIELIDRQFEQDDFDEEGYTKVQSRRMVLKVEHHKLGDRALALIQRIKRKAADEGYGQLYVKYHRGDTDREEAAHIPTDVDEASDVLFARLEIISGFDEPLKQCVAEIVPAIEKKMVELLRTEALWR